MHHFENNKNNEKQRRWNSHWNLLIILLAIALIVRIGLALLNHVSGDACWHLTIAKFIGQNHELPFLSNLGRDEPFWPPPLFHIIGAFFYSFFSIFNETIATSALLLLNPILGVISIFIVYHIAAKLFGKHIGIYSAFFFSFVPFHIELSTTGYVEMLLALFCLLTIYFALENKNAWCGFFAGLAASTKYTGLFVLPVAVFILIHRQLADSTKQQTMKQQTIKQQRTQRKEAIKKISLSIGLFLCIFFLISLPYLIRNFVLIGNPVYPMFQNVFSSIQTPGFDQLHVSHPAIENLLDLTKNLKTLFMLYITLFGIPNGSLEALKFISIPFLTLLLGAWFISTILFALPILNGLYILIRNKTAETRFKMHTLFLLLLCFTIALILPLYNYGETDLRFFFPALVALAIIWGIGMRSSILFIRKKTVNTSVKKLVPLIWLALIIIATSFVAISFFKAHISRSSWEIYDDDFSWIKAHTPSDSLFFYKGQCFTYNTNRKVTKQLQKPYNYVWINNKFALEPESLFTSEEERHFQNLIATKELSLVYKNPATGTSIYKKSIKFII